jgi:predicted RNA-binding Zn-ribbon protein involved in translation (DUF1610 family)
MIRLGNGVGELVLGFILILVFVATLTIETIPIIWTGALISGIILIIRGIYNSLKGEKPITTMQPLPNSTISSRATSTLCPECGREISAEYSFCPSCGYNFKHKCRNCGKTLDTQYSFCPDCGRQI